MKPTQKSEAVEQTLQNLTGHDRRKSIRVNRCVPAPIGCGQEATKFKDELSKREFAISGLCQECQDKFFG